MYKKEAKVAKIIDEYSVVINKGSKDGVEAGQRFLIYSLGDEVIDPESKENLGQVELVKGTGKVTHLQEKIATIESDMKDSPRKTIRKPATRAMGLLSFYREMDVVEETLPPQTMPFEEIKLADYVRPV